MSDITTCPDIKQLTLEAYLNKDNQIVLLKIVKDIVLYFNNFSGLVDLDLVRWMELEANKNNSIAQNNLGYMYRNGFGVEQDYKKAVELYILSADQGYMVAQNNLGYMYDIGLGVEQDYKKAVELYALSADQGYMNMLRII